MLLYALKFYIIKYCIFCNFTRFASCHQHMTEFSGGEHHSLSILLVYYCLTYMSCVMFVMGFIGDFPLFVLYDFIVC